MNDVERKRQLVSELARARGAISRHGVDARAALDVGARVRRSVKSNPLVWIAGGVVLVGIVALAFRRRPLAPTPAPTFWAGLTGRTEQPSTAKSAVAGGAVVATLLTAGRWLLPVFRPFAISYLTRLIGERFGGAEDARASGRR